jgi:hypothetical protein
MSRLSDHRSGTTHTRGKTSRDALNSIRRMQLGHYGLRSPAGVPIVRITSVDRISRSPDAELGSRPLFLEYPNAMDRPARQSARRVAKKFGLHDRMSLRFGIVNMIVSA